MPRYASLIYNGYWWSPEREALQTLIDHTQRTVNGKVTLRLYKGNAIVVSRSSPDSLFDARISTFEDDEGAYDQADAGGFIKLNALRLRIAANKAAGRAGRPAKAASKGAAKSSQAAARASKAEGAAAAGAASKAAPRKAARARNTGS